MILFAVIIAVLWFCLWLAYKMEGNAGDDEEPPKWL